MTEVLRISKRILTVGVVITTIAWSIGFAAFVMPLAAEAATLAAGDLIKASQPAVYYYAADGKRYVFPNENTYYSWYPNFSTLKEITDAELAAISIGGNITIRPGTFLVKITTDPKVYAVTTGGVLHWVETEAVAQKLWGTNWASWVVDVPDSFFTNYSIGSSISTYVHPNGCLIKYASGATVYYIQDGQKRAIASEAAFNANMFQWRFVISPAAADVTYTDGTAITGGEAGIKDLVAGVSGTGTGLSVALAADTPAGATVAQGSSSVQLIKIGVTASADGNVILNTLTFHRLGVGTASDFENVYLYEGSTRLTSGRSINTSSNEAQFNNLNLTINAGATKYLTVRGDLDAAAIAADEHALELVSATSVGTTATVTGSFPIRGNTFTVGAQDAATLTVQKGSTPSNPTVGQLEATISSFKLTATSADIKLNQISLIQSGTVVNSDLTNLKLYAGSEKVAETAVMVGDKMTFVLATPYLIANGLTKTFYVKADVAGKGGRTIVTYLEYTTDVDATDNTYGWGAAVNIDAFDSGDTITVTTQGGQLTVAYNGPATGTMPKAGQDQIFFKFGLTAAENTLEVRKLSFTLAGVSTTNDLIDTAGTDLFTDIKVVDTDSGTVVAGPTQQSSATVGTENSTSTATWVLTDSFYVNAGTTKNLAIKADVANNAYFDNDHAYRVKLEAFAADYVKNVATGEYLATTQIVPNALITGNIMTVKSSSLTVQLAATPVSDVWVKKTTNVGSAGFVFTAGSQSSVKVTSIKLTGYGSVAGAASTTAQLDDVITQLTLWDGATQLGSAKSPDGTLGTATFDGLSWTIPAGETKTLVVKSTLDSVASTGANNDRFYVGINADTDISAEDADANSVTPTDGDVTWSNPKNDTFVVYQTVKNSGTLTMAAESNPSTDIVVAGKDAWTTFVQAKLTAQYEDVTVDKIRLQRFSGGNNGDFKYLAIQKDGVIVSSGTDQFPGSATATDITLTTPITVPADGNVTFQVVGKLNAIDTGAISGDSPKLAIEYDVQTGEWDANYDNRFNLKGTGAQSGEIVYAAAAGALAGNPMVIRKTKLTFARQSLSTSLVDGPLDLYSVKVTADSAGDGSIAKIGFALNQSGTFSVDTLKWLKDGTDITDQVDIVDATGASVEGGTDASGTIYVRYTSGTEQSISGSGHIFKLNGTVLGASTGESLNVAIKTGSVTVYTYYMNSAPVGGVPGPNLDANGAVGGEVAGNLIWSDKSKIPHSAQYDTLSSQDWTDEYLVKDLTESQVLSF